MAQSATDLDADISRSPVVREAVGRAMRIDDAFREFRERRGRRRGRASTVIPYTGYGSTTWVRVLGRVLLTDAVRARRPNESVRGWRSFTSVPVDGVPVRVTIGDREHTVYADRGGVIDVRLDADLEPGWHRVRMVTADPNGPDRPAVEAPVFVFDPTAPFGIVSDVDDTVMVTALPHPLLAAWNTFVLDEHARRAVPGMAVLYDRLTAAHPGCPVIYLSTGAWNIVPTLNRFLTRHLFPRGTFLLTDWGPTADRWFRSGQEHKQASLARLAVEFPRMRWLLVGDDGQHDEVRYREFAQAHPENVAAVAIRELTPGEAMLAGGRAQREEHAGAAPWVYGVDGAELAEALTELGLLDTPRA